MTLKGKPMAAGVLAPLVFLCVVWELVQFSMLAPFTSAPAYADAADVPGVTETYSLTIPACLVIDEQQTGSMNITGTLQANNVLTVSASSSGMLRSVEGARLAYKLDGADFTVRSYENAVDISQTVTATVTQTPVCSGTYTDCVTFTITCLTDSANPVDHQGSSEEAAPSSDAVVGETSEPSVSAAGSLGVSAATADSGVPDISTSNDATQKDGASISDAAPADDATSSDSSAISRSDTLSAGVGAPGEGESVPSDPSASIDASDSSDSVGQTESNLDSAVSLADGPSAVFATKGDVPTAGILNDLALDAHTFSLSFGPVHSAREDCPPVMGVTERARISALNNSSVSS